VHCDSCVAHLQDKNDAVETAKREYIEDQPWALAAKGNGERDDVGHTKST